MSTPKEAKLLIDAGLESCILLPGDPQYDQRNGSYYDNVAKVHPACIVQPQNAQQVAIVIKTLASSGQSFAIRSGGHGNQPGTNNISGGVTIDLGHLNAVRYDQATGLAHLGPGATWKQVYDELEKYNRVVGGSRAGGIGVGGYLLGGGISFDSAQDGFACDNIVSYEVVLADASIVVANSEQHSDLFICLKGGGNNFGIVTNFVMMTRERSSPYWGLSAAKSRESAPTLAKALQEFTANVAAEPDNSFLYVVAHLPSMGGDLALTLTVNAAGKQDPEMFKGIKDTPDVFASAKMGNVQELLPFTELPMDHYNIWYTLTFKNEAEITSVATDLLFKLAEDLKAKVGTNDFSTYCAFQPLPLVFAQRSVAIGGNVMGLEKYPHDAILLQAAISLKASDHIEWARAKVKGLIDQVREYAGEDRICPWLYLNYCNSEQAALESYGAENVKKIRAAAAKYDPEGVFQRLCPGGFKISKVTV